MIRRKFSDLLKMSTLFSIGDLENKEKQVARRVNDEVKEVITVSLCRFVELSHFLKCLNDQKSEEIRAEYS